MTDPFTDRYWVEEFQVTEADLDRIEAYIRRFPEQWWWWHRRWKKHLDYR